MPKGPAVCVTGHRPPKLPGGYAGDEEFNNFVAEIVRNYYNVGYRTFISGGAIGIDQIFAEGVLRLKNEGLIAELIIARPFPSQASKWPLTSQQRYEVICQRADLIVDVCNDPYSPRKMQIRNEWMVDHAVSVLAFWDGEKRGGTWNCIYYAISKQKIIQTIHPFTHQAHIL